jgi:hypothetical protein
MVKKISQVFYGVQKAYDSVTIAYKERQVGQPLTPGLEIISYLLEFCYNILC